MEERRYFGCSVRQRQDKDTVAFFVFYARAKDIKEWIGIKRVKDSEEGTQRILRQTRRKAITRFIKSDSINTIPNNILIAFEEEKAKFAPLKDSFENLSFESTDFKNNCDDQISWGFLDKDDDDDSLLEIFCAIWRAIKNNYPELWVQDNKFMKKVNMDAMNEFITGRLKVIWEIGVVDIFDSSSIENQVSNIMRSLSPKFWELEWSIKIQDNASVRKMIKEDLEIMANNYRMRQLWNENLKLPMVNEMTLE